MLQVSTDTVRTFAALGDPVRGSIVTRLGVSDATVGEIAAMFTISIQAVSQHLDVLERAGIIARHREGRTRRVQLQSEPISDAAQWLEARRRRLEERYARLDELLVAQDDARTAKELKETP